MSVNNQKPTKVKMTGLYMAGFFSFAGLVLPLAGCQTEQVFSSGAQIRQEQLDLISLGSSRDQVLLALGTPSTTGTFDNEVFYYISQKRKKTLAFQKARVADQRVLAVYFDENSNVGHLADYGLKDGRIFDFINRTTPTGGKDLTFIGRLLDFSNSKPTF